MKKFITAASMRKVEETYMLSIQNQSKKTGKNSRGRIPLNERLVRQGDIMLVPLDVDFQKKYTTLTPIGEIPEDTVPQNNNVVAIGERTGHDHTLHGGSAQILVNPTTGQQFVSLEEPEMETRLVHQEHNVLPVLEEKTVVIHEREHDYIDGMFKQVVD